MKHIKTFKQLNEQLFKKETSLFNKLMGIAVEETGGEEPGMYSADNPSGSGNELVPAAKVDTSQMDQYGSSVGITNKGDDAPLQQPSKGPLGNIVNSAYANLNVSTRKIPGTQGGNLGCAAGVSIIFYRATGYAIAGSGAITLGTAAMWDYLSKESSKSGGCWTKITDWKKDSKPGDIILTSRGSQAGHVGVVVDGGKIISNSSGPFRGDKKGQIELNFDIDSWDSVAKRNPTETASFRYKGPYKSTWGEEKQNIVA